MFSQSEIDGRLYKGRPVIDKRIEICPVRRNSPKVLNHGNYYSETLKQDEAVIQKILKNR
jgi:hypothetical protein